MSNKNFSLGSCCPTGVETVCPQDNFALNCTLEIDGCRRQFGIACRVEHLTHKKVTGETDNLVLDVDIASFPGGEAQFLLFFSSKPVELCFTTAAGVALGNLIVVPVPEPFVGTGPYQLANIPVNPGFTVVQYTDGAAALVTLTDDGIGGLADSGPSTDTGTIDYATGIITITFNAGLTSAVTASYQYLQSQGVQIIPVDSFLHSALRFTGLTVKVSQATDVELWVGTFET